MDTKNHFKLSHAQQEIFIDQHIRPQSNGYNLGFVCELQPHVSHASLEKALHRLLLEHKVFSNLIYQNAAQRSETTPPAY